MDFDWRPPAHWPKLTTIDAHTGGEPFRVITGPELKGENLLQKRRFVTEHLDHLRRALMWEPRGHADMYGCFLTPPSRPEADFGILFLHNEGLSTMCGHGIIAIVKVLLQTGQFPRTEPVTRLTIETPAGLVHAEAQTDNGRVGRVAFLNVPSFVVELDASVEVPKLGKVCYDLAFGGAFYAYVEAEQLGLRCEPSQLDALIDKGRAIKKAVMKSRKIEHPTEEDLSFLYGVIFVDSPTDKPFYSRNVCVFADGEVDRSPTGTGVSGRLAIHHKRKEIGLSDRLVVESIVGSKFEGEVFETTTFGPHEAIIPKVSGEAFITGRHEFYLDPDDPFVHGFLLR